MKSHEAGLRLKVYLLLGLFILAVAALMAGLYRHQVTNRDRYLAWAERQQFRPVRLIPLRGKILDRRGRPLAVSIEAGSVFSRPAAVKDADAAARRLAPLLGMDPERVRARLTSGVSFVWLARQIPLAKARAIQRLGLKGIGVEMEGKRYYPNRELAANVVGFAGIDSQGLEGLELAYDGELRGTRESLFLLRDAHGDLLWQGIIGGGSASRGRQLVLTLDLRIQFFAERALREAVRGCGASSGSVVVLDPATGEVLAMASVPTFNPNHFGASAPASWRNRAITDLFEPGSTVKPLLLAAALEEGVVDEETRIDCAEGKFFIGGHWIHDMEENGEMTVREVIVHSSNVGATQIALRVGPERLWRYFDAFGFGRKTGIDLPGEAAGALRPWRRWSRVALATHAFGQGFSVTTLQLAAAFAALADGGILRRPFLVREIRDERGEVIRRFRPDRGRRVISRETARRVLAVMEGVVEEGTGRRARLAGLRVAGKTGTAQKFDRRLGRYSEEKGVVSFVGVVPADRPRMVIAVVIDEAEGRVSGGKTAAPVFRRIASAGITYLGVATGGKSDEGGERRRASMSPPEPRPGEGTAGRTERVMGTGPGPWRMPDLRRLTFRSALRLLEGLPVTIRIEGTGRIRRQSPRPGAPVQAGEVLRLVGACSSGTPVSREG